MAPSKHFVRSSYHSQYSVGNKKSGLTTSGQNKVESPCRSWPAINREVIVVIGGPR